MEKSPEKIANRKINIFLKNRKPSQFKSIVLGILGAVIGALIWYFVAKFANLTSGYLAILIGVLVGVGMKIGFGGNGSKKLAIFAAIFSLLGVILGNFMLWYFEMPQWTRESLVEDFYLPQEEVDAISDSEIREDYGFIEYFKDDLTSTEGGHNPVYAWLFYTLAVVIGFTRVHKPKEKLSTQPKK